MSTRIKKNGACPFTSLLFLRYCMWKNQHTTRDHGRKDKGHEPIKQLLLLKKEGVSNRKAAEIVGINKETANNYVRKALADRLGIDGLLKLDDPVLEHRLKGGNPAYTDSRFEVFKELLPYLQEEMRRKHVTLKLLWGGIRGGAPRRPLQPHPVPLSLQPEHRGEEGVSIDRSGGHAHGRREALP